MAELNVKNPSLADVLSRTDVAGNIAQIIEIADKINPIMQHAYIQECNNGATHTFVTRTGIPEPAFRRYNQGLQQLKSTTAKATIGTGMIEAYVAVDRALAQLGNREAAFRLSEVAAVMEGFSQFVARNFFYGSTKTNPDGFMGLDAFYNDPTAQSGRQIIDAGGTGSTNTSIWFVTYGPRATSLIYPKGSPAGFNHRDLGEQQWDAPDGSGKFPALVDHLQQHVGVAVGDWRANARVANIDVDALSKDASTGADIIDLMIDAEEVLDTKGRAGVDDSGNLVEGKTVIYTDRVVAKFLRKQALNKQNVNLTVENVGGERVTMWGEMPIVRVDAISTNEAAIPFA